MIEYAGRVHSILAEIRGESDMRVQFDGAVPHSLLPSSIVLRFLIFLPVHVYSVVQKTFPLFETPASFLPSKMASPCTANWP